MIDLSLDDTCPEAFVEVVDGVISLVVEAEATVVDRLAAQPFPKHAGVPREYLFPPSEQARPMCRAAGCGKWLDEWEQYWLDTGECAAHHVVRVIERIAPKLMGQAEARDERQQAQTIPVLRAAPASAIRGVAVNDSGGGNDDSGARREAAAEHDSCVRGGCMDAVAARAVA